MVPNVQKTSGNSVTYSIFKTQKNCNSFYIFSAFPSIKEEHKEHNYPIAALCKLGRVSRAAYYKWLHREIPESEQKNRLIADVTEFHYYIGMEKRKVYLSAILDLYDRRIVSYVIRDKNNNALVFDTVDNALLS